MKKAMSIVLVVGAGAVLFAKTVNFGGAPCCGSPPPPCPPDCSPIPQVPTGPAGSTGVPAPKILGRALSVRSGL